MSPNSEPIAGWTLIRGGHVAREKRTEAADVLCFGSIIVALGTGVESIAPTSRDLSVVEADGKLVMPALVDGHCHLLGGGGGDGPQSQNLPLLLQDFTSAGIGTAVGVLGHDTVVRTTESLLSRAKALRSFGMNVRVFAGEIGNPPSTVTGSVTRDIALLDDVSGLKVSLGESVSVRDANDLATLYAQVTAGSRTAGKPPHLHVHVGSDPACLAPLQEAIERRLVIPSCVSITHVNWNRAVLEASLELARLGVHVDLTACIRPDFFPGSVDPYDALDSLLNGLGSVRQVTASSDAGGAHTNTEGSTFHSPALLLDVLRGALADGKWPPHVLARCFARNIADRLGLFHVGRVEEGVRADLLVIPREGDGPIDLLLAGRAVVLGGRPLALDPITR